MYKLMILFAIKFTVELLVYVLHSRKILNSTVRLESVYFNSGSRDLIFHSLNRRCVTSMKLVARSTDGMTFRHSALSMKSKY
jgi:hypothetical protein